MICSMSYPGFFPRKTQLFVKRSLQAAEIVDVSLSRLTPNSLCFSLRQNRFFVLRLALRTEAERL